ncbi:hypothetical protein [Amorphus sp. MBR-141]
MTGDNQLVASFSSGDARRVRLLLQVSLAARKLLLGSLTVLDRTDQRILISWSGVRAESQVPIFPYPARGPCRPGGGGAIVVGWWARGWMDVRSA